MKRFITLVIVSGLLTFLCGCSTTQRTLVVGANNSDANVIYQKDVPYLTSVKKHSVILGVANPILSNDLSNLPTLDLVIKNGGNKSIDVGLGNVTIKSMGVSVKLYSQSEIKSAIEKAAKRRQIGLAIAAGMQQMGAAMQASAPQYSQTYGTANAYNSYTGNTRVNYSAYTTTYNPGANAAAQATASASINAQMQSNMALVDMQMRDALGVNTNVFGRNTVSPGDMADGRLIFDGKAIKGDDVEVRIRLDGEEHVFALKVTEQKK
jgi:hypothetical protein